MSTCISFKHTWVWLVLLAVPLVVASTLVYANSNLWQQPSASSFICPLTGEELPCERCCPLNKDKEVNATNTDAESHPILTADVKGFMCPITGEELPCPLCCPL